MDDLISRNALIAEYDRVYVGAAGGARKLMQDAPAVNRWISVEDALPEKAGNYLCTLYYAIPPYNLFHPEKDTYIRETSVKFFDGKSFISSVIAWMLMPDAYEPPKEDEA